jgi:pimeloyl-ACP methyl ester carboxylesterase
MTTVKNGDVTLYVRDAGDGIPVMLLHGWPDTGDLWDRQSRTLVAAGYRTIVPDLRGFGASDQPAEVSAYAAEAQVGDVVGVLDALGVDRAHLVGHDWGAAIAWMTAAYVPSGSCPGTCCCSRSPASRRSGCRPATSATCGSGRVTRRSTR